MSTLAHTGRGNVIQPDGDSVPVRIEWKWTEADPLVVQATFVHDSGEEMFWEFSRDVLNDTLRDCKVHGEHRVVTSRKWPDTMVLELTGEDTRTGKQSTAVIVTTDHAVRQVVQKSLRIVPLGEEAVDVDGALELILGGAA